MGRLIPAGCWIPSAVAVLATLYATSLGVGLSPDSVTYIAVARNLLHGRGLVESLGTPDGVLLTHFPPLFPALLAGLGFAWQADPIEIARYLNALLFGATVGIVVLALGWPTGSRVTGAGVLAGLLIALQQHIITLHAMAWSEPLFLLLALLSVFLLVLHVSSGQPAYLVASSVLAAASCLTRYVGLAVLLTGLVMLGASPGVSWTIRVRRVLFFLAVAALPLATWLAITVDRAGHVANRTPGLYALGPGDLSSVLAAVAGWLLPDRLARTLGRVGAGWALVIVALALTAYYLSQAMRTLPLRHTERGWRREQALLWSSGIFIGWYLATVAVSKAFMDPAIPFDTRILSPVYVFGNVAASVMARSVVRQGRAPRWVMGSFRAILAILLLSFASRSYLARSNAHRTGLGFTHELYRTSAIVDALRSVPEEIRAVVSNNPELVYIVTGRPARRVPQEPTTLPAGDLVACFTSEGFAYEPCPEWVLRGANVRAVLVAPGGTLYRGVGRSGAE